VSIFQLLELRRENKHEHRPLISQIKQEQKRQIIIVLKEKRLKKLFR
jgi:hypothetical protein